jgi:hypothetical protein
LTAPHDRSAALEERAAELRAEVEELRRELLKRQREHDAGREWVRRLTVPVLIGATLVSSGVVGYLGWRRGWGGRVKVAGRPLVRILAS